MAWPKKPHTHQQTQRDEGLFDKLIRDTINKHSGHRNPTADGVFSGQLQITTMTVMVCGGPWGLVSWVLCTAHHVHQVEKPGPAQTCHPAPLSSRRGQLGVGAAFALSEPRWPSGAACRSLRGPDPTSALRSLGLECRQLSSPGSTRHQTRAVTSAHTALSLWWTPCALQASSPHLGAHSILTDERNLGQDLFIQIPGGLACSSPTPL